MISRVHSIRSPLPNLEKSDWCVDAALLNSAMWDELNTGDQLRSKNSESHLHIVANDHKGYAEAQPHPIGNFTTDFADPLQNGQSLGTCTIDDPCKRPDCHDMDFWQEAGSGWKYLVEVSLVNFNIVSPDSSTLRIPL
jgi:hypothetical protein